MNITNKDNCAAIGVGVGGPGITQQSTCGNISIINSDITATTTHSVYRCEASLIGTSASPNSNTKCGTIDIYLKDGQTITNFLDKLTNTGRASKVGNGYTDGYYGANAATTGTITWYGAVIGTGSTGKDK